MSDLARESLVEYNSYIKISTQITLLKECAHESMAGWPLMVQMHGAMFGRDCGHPELSMSPELPQIYCLMINGLILTA